MHPGGTPVQSFPDVKNHPGMDRGQQMDHQLITSSLAGLSDGDRRGMFRLRYETFRIRLGWDVPVTADGLETDGYDQLGQARYILARDPDGAIDACWRLLPTQGPNMLRDVFPELLQGLPVPCAADCWEISRFAIATGRTPVEGSHPQLGFGQLSVAIMAEATRFAEAHGIVRYVTVTTVGMERLLRKQGVNIHRMGPPMRIGLAMTVACLIELDGITLRALGR